MGRGSVSGASLTVGWATALAMAALPAAGQSLDAFWHAESGELKSREAAAVVATGADFATLFARLKSGRDLPVDAPTGRVETERTNRDGTPHRYFFLIPEAYDPARRYPVRIFLHGGVSRPRQFEGGSWWRRWQGLTSDEYIAVFPASWEASLWWQASQVENLRGILADLKRSYNVDENRIAVIGVSDGGTGAYFLGFKDVTPYASFLPFIGHAAVLLSPTVNADGDMHVANLVNRPFFIVNGETDRLYPAHNVRPWIEAFGAAGVELVFKAMPTGHDTSWWADEAADIETFIQGHPRDPLPDELIWVTETADRYNRAHWVVIDELSRDVHDPEGILDQLAESEDAGVVRAVRDGNNVVVTASRVGRVTLLLSPEEFDLSRPVSVEANGRVVHDGLVEPDPATLLKWAAADDDRTMLFAAELTVDLGR